MLETYDTIEKTPIWTTRSFKPPPPPTPKPLQSLTKSDPYRNEATGNKR